MTVVGWVPAEAVRALTAVYTSYNYGILAGGDSGVLT